MTRLLAWFFTVLLLLQSFGQEVLVVNYQVNKARITQLFCVNKARPRLHCNGKCYLAKQLRKASDGPGKAPGVARAKVKMEVLPAAFARLRAPHLRRWQTYARRWVAAAAAPYALEWVVRLLRPPVSFN